MSESQAKKTVTIEQMAMGGKGVARLDGKVIFVKNVGVGDVVEVELVNDKNRYAEAEVVQFLERGPSYTNAPCVYFGKCGGCQWQDATYEAQLDWKKDIVAQQFERIGKLGKLDIGITGSPEKFGYRNRVLLRIHFDERGEKQVGFFKSGSRELVGIDKCLISESAINEFIQKLLHTEFGLKNLQLRFEVQVFNELSGIVSVVVYPNERYDQKAAEFAKIVGKLSGVLFCELLTKQTKPFLLHEKESGISYFTIPGIFQQVNLKANKILRQFLFSEVVNLNLGPSKILDLFCGNGNLSLQFCELHQVTGVEFNAQAISCAKKSTDQDYRAGHAHKILESFVRDKKFFDLVIVDPPREGMKECVESIVNLKPQYIFYVSCDPATLARDLLALKEFYEILKVQCFDFFPQTYHVESLVILKRMGR